MAYDPYIPEEVAKNRNVALVSLNELCRNADLISVHAPLLPSTKGMIGKEQFQLMKKGVSIINTSRGPVIDEEAFIEALQAGIVAGAGLDVVEQEPIAPDHPFLSMSNVVLTPHSAWYSEEAAVEVRSKTALGVVDVLVYGEYPKYLANRQVMEKTKLHPHLTHERYNFDRDAILQKMKAANKD
ncbi:MAG TPA: NAD(P)-dependent oxidoreductase [Brevibacillus sp.]|nr:NAD(P)-dependent oxidoreductase [Brevibacillus sp.]